MNKIYVVGIGPGEYDQMTIRAARVLESCEVIVGYTVYVDLVKEHFADKIFLSAPMTREAERCRMAFEQAAAGHVTAMICSGDAGVYGMSGLMLQIRTEYPEVDVEIVPGVTAAVSGAAVLGAPLIHDFAVISLSDLLTPWEDIERRILAAAEADFVICFYNPSSRKRRDYLRKACDLILRFRNEDTVCGIASNIGREGETVKICTLRELRDLETDMFTTVFAGNSRTRTVDGWMVTPRGYRTEQKCSKVRTGK
ncbi:MAG: precorrin-3B C(17)-methyltransferase [Lachnospiraceae bacterium]|nr:precorrin-3B C(17)-methyltransferase [Lachnospiraceae bacterium]